MSFADELKNIYELSELKFGNHTVDYFKIFKLYEKEKYFIKLIYFQDNDEYAVYFDLKDSDKTFHPFGDIRLKITSQTSLHTLIQFLDSAYQHGFLLQV